MNNSLEIKNLCVRFNNYDALKDISFNVPKGSFLNVVGPNGSGKTTLIEVLTNQITKYDGVVTINETNIGYLPQKLNAKKNFPITVSEVIKTASNLKISDDEINKWLMIMDIPNLKNENMSVLSGGQQQRVYIIRALINKPNLLILDEPTSALDPGFREGFYIFLNNLQKQMDLTIINVTHDLADVQAPDSLMLYLDQELKYFGKTKDYYEFENRGHHHV